MITREELARIARRRGFPLHVMEKDYALTWVLKAIYSNERLSNYLVFKGGTCLSKVYAEEYRLSEDLDFSSEGKLGSDELKAGLRSAFAAANRLGAPSLELIEGESHENPGLLVLQIRYTGPLGQPGRIKFELMQNEKLMLATESLPLKEKEYSDIGDFKIRCYSFTEVLVEKTRAMMQRGKTRDYYDVWQMMTRKELRSLAPHSIAQLRSLLKEKCGINGIKYAPEIMFDGKRLEEARGHWQAGLGRLVKDLPEFDKVIGELRGIFRE